MSMFHLAQPLPNVAIQWRMMMTYFAFSFFLPLSLSLSAFTAAVEKKVGQISLSTGLTDADAAPEAALNDK